MGNIGTSAGIGGLEGSLSWGLSGAIAGGWPGLIVGAIAGGIVGSATSAIATYIAQQRPASPRLTSDTIQTDAIRIKPVPIVFGRARLGGNWIGIGKFFNHDPYRRHKVGDPCKIMNGLLGLCEGPITQIGNYRCDGELLKAIRARENLPCKVLRFNTFAGTPNQAGAASLTDTRYGYIQSQVLPIPFRNTAYIDLTVWCGTSPRLPQIQCDIVSADYTIRRGGTTAETNPGDLARYGFYDSSGDEGHFFYTLASSATISAPFGLARVGRFGDVRAHTPPPAGVGTVSHAWAWSKHDVVLMQDPSDASLFYIGYWGIAPNSADWEHARPSNQRIGAGYTRPIISWYHDEHHSMLHTLHDDGTTRYILRWNVLTGHIERIDTDLAAGTFQAMMYSIDLGYYIVTRDSAFLAVLDGKSGETLKSTTGITTTFTAGICVSGQQVGVITASNCYYFDVYSGDISVALGTGDTDVNVIGGFGGTVSATQNTFTGQVCLTKQSSGTVAFVNFIPSTVEDIRDINANGTSGLSGLPVTSPDPINYGEPEPNFQSNQIIGSQNFPADRSIGQQNPVCNATIVHGAALLYTTDWIRDWSVRTFNQWSLKALEGNSSLAAALWGITVNEPSYDSQRWGAAFDPALFSLASFEGLHAWCVGAMRFANSPDSYPVSRLGERYKFDFTLDAETTIAAFWQQHGLMAAQAYSHTVGGVCFVSAPKPGILPIWSFNDNNIEEGTLGVQFNGTAEGVNRVRVQYRNTLDEYRHDFAEAEDSNAIEATGRVQVATLTIEGCGRGESAVLLAKTVLDQSAAGRRQASFKSDYISYIIAPGDAVTVTSTQCGLDAVPMRVSSIKETSDQNKRHRFGFDCVEYKQVLDALLTPIATPGQPGLGDGSNAYGLCVYATAPSEDQTPNLDNEFNLGAVMPAGTYSVTYQNGTYTKASGNFFVDGFEIWARNGSSPYKLCDAPAVSDPIVTGLNPHGGYPDEESAEDANYGQTTSFTLSAAAQIYVKRPSTLHAFTAADSPLCYWQLCETDPA